MGKWDCSSALPRDIVLHVIRLVDAVGILIHDDQRRRLHNREAFAELRLFLRIDQLIGDPGFLQQPARHLAIWAGLRRKQQDPAFRGRRRHTLFLAAFRLDRRFFQRLTAFSTA